MKKYYLLLILLKTLSISLAQDNQLDKATKRIATRLDSMYTQLYDDTLFNGNILVAKEGNVIFEKSYGLANESTKEKLNIETVFELASVTKQFTAMGIVLLAKQGKISYDDDITEYIPEMSHYNNITIKNLLTHTGGLPDYMELTNEHWDKSKIATNEDIISLFEKVQPENEFEPNAKWSYSNTGYLLLATIIERVSNEPYGDFLRKNIFEPLNMSNTFVYRRRYRPQKVRNYAQGYIYSDSLSRLIVSVPRSTSCEVYF